MLVDADGTRHSFYGNISPYSSGSTSTLHTTDGTFIDYTAEANSVGTLYYAQAKYPNGTIIQYGAPGAGAVYPTYIADANGNYITITYVNNAGPQIETLTDTLGRVVNFYYDVNNLLTAVVGPNLNGGTRTLARLHYTQLPTLSADFGGLTPIVRNYTPWALDAIYYPATNSGYWFGDVDSYSSYGMIQKVVEQRSMGFSALSLNEQGTVTPGVMFDPAHPRPSAASAAPGETSLVVDAWGKERWGRTDARGRLVEVVEPDPDGSGSVTSNGLLTTYSYDTQGDLIEVVQGQQHRLFSYDSLGRLIRQKLAETDAVFNSEGQYVGLGGAGAMWSDLFVYDTRSNLVSRTDARNVKTAFSYQDAQGNQDPLNRLQTVSDTTVSGGTAYLYRVRGVDVGGNRSAPSNVALGTAITFTDNPIVAGVTTIKAQHLNELRQAVNAIRSVAGLAAATWTDPVLTTQVTPVRAVHIQELRDSLNEALTALQISTSPFTDPALATGASGTTVKRVHVEELRQRASSGQSTSSGGSSSAPVPRDGFEALSYDTATNRINTAGWEYDAAGNQTRVQVAGNVWQRYDYDAADRLVAVKTDAGAVIASYTYCYSNARLISQEGGTRTYYAWGGSGIIAEYMETDGTPSANSPQWSKNYIYLGGRLLATQQPIQNGERVEYHHPDRLGTRVVSNNADATYYEQTTLPFGTALNAESTGATGRRFTSYDRSLATGLDYAVNRSYDSQQGRFTQVDPEEMGAVDLQNPQTLNLYAYCGNDPVNRLDPSGLGFFSFFKKLFKGIGKAFKWIGIGLAVAAIVATAIIFFAPAGSFIFKAAVWMFVHVLLPIAHMPIIGALFPMGMTFSTPSLNPNARGFGNGWQQDAGNPDNIPDCSQGNVLPCYASDVVKTTSRAPAWPGVFDRLFDGFVTFSAGYSDTLTFGGSIWARRKLAGYLAGEGTAKRASEIVDQDTQRMQQSWAYTGGEVVAYAVDLATGEEVAVAASRAAGWGGKFAVHTAHHSFGRFGRLSHLQLNVWKAGVKGSGKTLFHIPLPLRKWPKKEIILRKW